MPSGSLDDIQRFTDEGDHGDATDTALIEDILSGTFDDVLDGIERAVRERKSLKARSMAFTLKPDETVRIKTNAALRPKYLLGTTWTVQRINQATVSLKPTAETAARHPRFVLGIRCPIEALERI